MPRDHIKELRRGLLLVSLDCRPETRHEAVEMAIEALDFATVYICSALQDVEPHNAYKALESLQQFLEASTHDKFQQVLGNDEANPFRESEVNRRTREEILGGMKNDQ